MKYFSVTLSSIVFAIHAFDSFQSWTFEIKGRLWEKHSWRKETLFLHHRNGFIYKNCISKSFISLGRYMKGDLTCFFWATTYFSFDRENEGRMEVWNEFRLSYTRLENGLLTIWYFSHIAFNGMEWNEVTIIHTYTQNVV